HRAAGAEQHAVPRGARLEAAQGTVAPRRRIPPPRPGHAGARSAHALRGDHDDPRGRGDDRAARQAAAARVAGALPGVGGAAGGLRRAARGRPRRAAAPVPGGKRGPARGMAAAAVAARRGGGEARARHRAARPRRGTALHRDHAGRRRRAAHAARGCGARCGRRRRGRDRRAVRRRRRSGRRGRRMSARGRLALALAWLALLLAAGAWVGQRLHLSGDLRAFMPAPRTPAQKLLIEEMGEGPGSRLLLVALSGADPATLAAQSRALRERLAGSPLFAAVEDGGAGLDAIPARLRPYRYLLSDTLDRVPFDADTLRGELQSRLQDLGSPAAALVEPLIASDPTLETLKLAEDWQPPGAPQRMYGVWFDRAGRQALLLAQTRAPGFDPDGQQAALDALRDAFAVVSAGSGARMEASGPGAFAVDAAARTRREAGWIGSVDTISLVLLLWFAYRSWKAPLLGVLPLASAGLAGRASVAALFDGVHGITVAFGFTLIGVVQDYPIHLFSHQRAGLAPRDGARQLWPTLATGVVSTCIAYVTFLASGVDGLQQLAVFTIAGLATAALATRFLLPALLDPVPAHDAARSPRLARLWARVERLPRPRRVALAAFAALALALVAFAPGPFWQDDLARLAPVPEEAMRRDTQLRGELGAPDVRYVVALEAPDA